MDRLSLLKVLADSSRYAIYQEVARADEPLSTVEVAARLELHPNTVRIHLEKMRDAGLLMMSFDRHGSVGRPQHRWALAAQAPGLGLEPSGIRVLAHLLAEVAAQPAGEPNRPADVGRRLGLERVRAGRGQTRRGHSRRSTCLDELIEELAALGFDPSLDEVVPGKAGATGLTRSTGPAGPATLSFARCPFREVAVLYPDLVCELHRGITAGILAGAVEARPGVEATLDWFSSLVDADPCRAGVTINA